MSPSVNQPLRFYVYSLQNQKIPLSKNHKDGHAEKLLITYHQKFESTCLSQSVELENSTFAITANHKMTVEPEPLIIERKGQLPSPHHTTLSPLVFHS